MTFFNLADADDSLARTTCRLSPYPGRRLRPFLMETKAAHPEETTPSSRTSLPRSCSSPAKIVSRVTYCIFECTISSRTWKMNVLYKINLDITNHCLVHRLGPL